MPVPVAAASPRGSRRPRRLRVLFCAVLAATLLVSCEPRPEAGPKAQAGVLDLRTWDFHGKGMLELSGEWAFYPGSLLHASDLGAASPLPVFRKVPDLWRGDEAGGPSGQGAGTYRLAVLLPPGSATRLAIRYKTVSTAFELDVNGATVAAVGKPALSAADAVASYRPGVAELPDAPGDRLDIVVRVSNHEYRSGGLWRSFVLGPRPAVEFSKRLADIWINAQIAAILIMVANSLLVFYFRRKELAYFWFALFGLALAYRLWVTGEYLIVNVFPEIGFDLLVRLEYVSVAVPIPLFVLFLSTLYPDESPPWIVALLCLPFAARILFGLPLTSLPVLTRSIYVFYAMALVSVAAILYVILLRAVARRREGALGLLVASFVLLLAFVNDTLYQNFIINTGNFLGFGLVGFILIQAGILAKRFARAFERSESLQSELAVVNGELATENERVRASQAELQVLLAEKDLLLKEVHHRVKNSLQIVSSTLGLESYRVGDPQAVQVYSMARSRIRAISLVHEKLYGLESGELLDLGEYARDLVDQLAGGFGGGVRGASIRIDSETIPADVDDCIDFGLILTELVANACKHTLAEGRAVSVSVRIRSEGDRVVLRVEDDGPGFPEGFDPARTDSLGFRVVWSLARKHGGEALVLPGPGAKIELKLALGKG